MKKHFENSWFFGWFLFGLAVFILLLACLVAGSNAVQQDRITKRLRTQACLSIKNEALKTTCITADSSSALTISNNG
jgi:hypothetical protein